MELKRGHINWIWRLLIKVPADLPLIRTAESIGVFVLVSKKNWTRHLKQIKTSLLLNLDGFHIVSS
tara:strand:+ start:75 stop:272 length:198 start_codon:yes stop_codon:yes gene_type:complete